LDKDIFSKHTLTNIFQSMPMMKIKSFSGLIFLIIILIIPSVPLPARTVIIDNLLKRYRLENTLNILKIRMAVYP